VPPVCLFALLPAYLTTCFVCLPRIRELNMKYAKL
jgi:hypothetical protein